MCKKHIIVLLIFFISMNASAGHEKAMIDHCWAAGALVYTLVLIGQLKKSSSLEDGIKKTAIWVGIPLGAMSIFGLFLAREYNKVFVRVPRGYS